MNLSEYLLQWLTASLRELFSPPTFASALSSIGKAHSFHFKGSKKQKKVNL